MAKIRGLRLGVITFIILLLVIILLPISVSAAPMFSPFTHNNVWGWGQNFGGSTASQLDVGAGIRDITPSFVVKSDGTVWTRIGSQITGLSNIKSICEARHMMALRTDGTVWTWGNNKFGQLGNGAASGSDSDYSTSPAQVTALKNIVAISSGAWQSIALKSDGTVWAWGHNAEGELGDGTTTDRWVPTKAVGLSRITAIAEAGYHALALRSDGTVWAWGWNNRGQVGDGTQTQRNTPIKVPGLNSIISIGAGGSTSMAVNRQGILWTWVANEHGQIGDGTAVDRPSPVVVLNGIFAVGDGGGGASSAALKKDGTVWTWGDNEYGQLGNGNNTDSLVPIKVPNLTGMKELKGFSFDYVTFGSNIKPKH
jgi:alpha-tubulin suppressor-like RCC1 family protein